MSHLPAPFSALLEEELPRTVPTLAGGAEVHLVGGILRDRYLSIQSPDIDLVVSRRGHEISKRIASELGARLVLLGGDRFAAYRLVRPDQTIDIWDRQGASLQSDLARRDFTVNAMALDLRSHRLHDPFGGLRDLEGRRLRMVTDTSFARDPLRVLRLVRFALVLPDFTINDSTATLARNSAARIDSIAIERIREELMMILAKGSPTRALELLSTLYLFPQLWGRADQPRKAAADLRRHLARYESTEELVEKATGRLPERLLCVHALIMTSLGEEESRPSQVGWPLLTRAQARSVTALLDALRDAGPEKPRPFLARCGELWREALAVWAATTGTSGNALRSTTDLLSKLVTREGAAVLNPQPLLHGGEIQELLELPPGPHIGRLLARLLEAQLCGEVTSRAQAESFVLQSRRSD